MSLNESLITPVNLTTCRIDSSAITVEVRDSHFQKDNVHCMHCSYRCKNAKELHEKTEEPTDGLPMLEAVPQLAARAESEGLQSARPHVSASITYSESILRLGRQWAPLLRKRESAKLLVLKLILN